LILLKRPVGFIITEDFAALETNRPAAQLPHLAGPVRDKENRAAILDNIQQTFNASVLELLVTDRENLVYDQFFLF